MILDTITGNVVMATGVCQCFGHCRVRTFHKWTNINYENLTPLTCMSIMVIKGVLLGGLFVPSVHCNKITSTKMLGSVLPYGQIKETYKL